MSAKRTNDQVVSPTIQATPTKTPRITRQTTMNCKVCRKPINIQLVDNEEEIVVTCRKCHDRFHGNCAGVTPDFYNNMISNSVHG